MKDLTRLLKIVILFLIALVAMYFLLDDEQGLAIQCISFLVYLTSIVTAIIKITNY